MATRIASEDLTWLLMDEPHNLMNVNGLIGFDELPDVDAVTDLVAQGVSAPVTMNVLNGAGPYLGFGIPTAITGASGSPRTAAIRST